MTIARAAAVFILIAVTGALLNAANSSTTEAVFPGTNGKIAFGNFTNNDSEIWTMNPDGSGRTKVTDTETFVSAGAAFSPDGQKIGFFRNTGDDETRGLYVINANGSGEQQIDNANDSAVDFAWSPDGNQIAFSRLLGPADVFKINFDGTNEVNLTPQHPGENRHPDWSPLGDKIAWSNGDIWVMDTDGSNKVNLTDNPNYFEDNPDWSPDGQRIIFDVLDTGFPAGNYARNIAVINADGTNLQMITNDSVLEQWDPVFSPDGQKIAYVESPPGSISFGEHAIFVADANGDNAEMISPASPDDAAPDWGVDEPGEPPTPQPTATPSPTPETGESLIWGDHNCSDSADPIDSLLTLRFDAGLGTNTGDCPALGDEVDIVDASLHLWGDVDCGDTVDPIDSLKLLRYDAGLSVSQADGCPEIGSEVQISPS